MGGGAICCTTMNPPEPGQAKESEEMLEGNGRDVVIRAGEEVVRMSEMFYPEDAVGMNRYFRRNHEGSAKDPEEETSDPALRAFQARAKRMAALSVDDSDTSDTGGDTMLSASKTRFSDQAWADGLLEFGEDMSEDEDMQDV